MGSGCFGWLGYQHLAANKLHGSGFSGFEVTNTVFQKNAEKIAFCATCSASGLRDFFRKVAFDAAANQNASVSFRPGARAPCRLQFFGSRFHLVLRSWLLEQKGIRENR